MSLLWIIIGLFMVASLLATVIVVAILVVSSRSARRVERAMRPNLPEQTHSPISHNPISERAAPPSDVNGLEQPRHSLSH